MMDLTTEGYIPTDWVEVTDKGLTKSDACILEQELIRKHAPTFNAAMGKKLLKLSKRSVETAKRLRLEYKLSYSKIADKLNSSTMTIWRALNGKNKNTND